MKDLILEEDFFDEVLFDIKEPQQDVVLNPQDVKLLVICDALKYAKEEHQLLAHNIIKALGYNLDSNAAVMSVDPNHIVNLADIQTRGYQYILVFGHLSTLVSTQINVPPNNLLVLNEQEWVATLPLEEFGDDKSKKMNLWNAIKLWKITE